jgi:hypothetical protein
MVRYWRYAALAGLGIVWASGWASADEAGLEGIRPVVASEPQLADPVAWRTDYRAALAEARQRNAMALLWFIDPQRPEATDSQESDLFRHKEVAELLDRYVPLKLSADATISAVLPADEAGTTTRDLRLLDHPAFAEMLGQRGLAIVDLRDPEGPYFHQVVSVLPLGKRSITPRHLTALLSLPDGSLTQRTLIWAVWTHAEHPLSASREPSPLLMREAASHADYQASVGAGGHHHWGERFQRINAQLPEGLVPQEVCAESWPGQRLVEAAEECVHSWRQSSGHWDAVRQAHPLFGYDMKRSAGGTWYATGIFARNR